LQAQSQQSSARQIAGIASSAVNKIDFIGSSPVEISAIAVKGRGMIQKSI
jgi:hypothetical protein